MNSRLSICVALVVALSTGALAGEDVIQSARGGRWSDPATWSGGKVPGQGSRVMIARGHDVRYDVESDAVVRGIVVAGKLRFARDRSTRLVVGLIKIQASDEYTEEGFDCDVHPEGDSPAAWPTLEIGTANEPIVWPHTATIRLAAVAGMDEQSCPALVCCGGRMELHGSPMERTWVKLGAEAKAGESRVVLDQATPEWRVGDRVVLTATNQHRDARHASKTEERTIQAIDGATLTLDQPLRHDHKGDGDRRGEVACLTRNVVVESATPDGVRGHTMYHKNSAGSLSYAEFRHLGKPGVLGRYSLHFHLAGDTMRGSSVIGCSIWDSGNRWLTIHGTNRLIVRDNVGYKSLGHGFFLEDGTEIQNVLDHNLGIGARDAKPLPKQVLPFDQNEGAGFWWANSLNTFTGNVAADCDLYGFRFEATETSALKLTLPVQRPDGTTSPTDIRTLPFVRFDDNEVHSSKSLYGVNLGEGVAGVGPDPRHPFVVRNLKIWDVHYAFRPQTPSLRVENLSIHDCVYGVYHPNFNDHFYKNVTIARTNAEPFNRGHDDLSEQHGLLAVDGLIFDGVRSGGMPLIQISDDNVTGRAVSHFRGVRTVNWEDRSRDHAVVNLGGGPRPAPKTAHGTTIYLHDWYGPGEHAEVVSTRSPEFKAAPSRYTADAPLTGDESRVAKTKDVEFPTPAEAIDDLPPSTVVTHVRREGNQVHVRGTTADNGRVTHVTINGQPATSLRGDFAEWDATIELPPGGEMTATAKDAAGNGERLPHTLIAP